LSGLDVITQPGAKLNLRSVITCGEQAIAREGRNLRGKAGFRSFTACVDELTELYLDFASELGSALDPQVPEHDSDARDAA
ncbi:MAG: hypothetical protein AAGH89_00095, partial [Verrucomicrobiota bacterium]